MGSSEELEAFVGDQIHRNTLEGFIEASLADAGMLADKSWDPSEHPRGPDGKFIDTGAGFSDVIDAAADFLDHSPAQAPERTENWRADQLTDEAFDFAERQLDDRQWDWEDQADAMEGTPDGDAMGAEQVIDGWKEDGYTSSDARALWATASAVLGEDSDADIPEFVDQTEVNVADAAPEVIRNLMAFSQEVVRRDLSDDGETVTVHRGIRGDLGQELIDAKDAGESVEIDPHLLESHSVEPLAAKRWADSRDGGVIIEREVPVEDVGFYGPAVFGSDLVHQQEVTLMGQDAYEVDPDQIDIERRPEPDDEDEGDILDEIGQEIGPGDSE